MGHEWYRFSQISSVLIRETHVYPCPDFKLSGSQIRHIIFSIMSR